MTLVEPHWPMWADKLVQADQDFAAEHGCKPMRSVFPYKWPLALDLLYRQYQVNKTKRLLAFQTPYFDNLGPSIEWRLFGDVGFLTFDPRNVEAILSTNFEGLPKGLAYSGLDFADASSRLYTWVSKRRSSLVSW